MKLLLSQPLYLGLFLIPILGVFLFLRFYLKDFINSILVQKNNLQPKDFKFWLTILPIVLFLVVPIVFCILEHTGNKAIDAESNGISMKYYFFITTLIIVSNLIVISNTVGFMNDCNETLMLMDANKADKGIKVREIGKKLIRDYVITIIVSFAIILTFVFNIALHYTFANEIEWSHIFRANEYLTLLIFFVFYRIDKNLFGVISNLTRGLPGKTENKNELRLLNLHSLTRRALIYVDFAGFIGVAIILFMSELFHLSENEVDHEQLKGFFVFGLSSGALAMHVIFTQINYNFLKTKYESREKEIEEASETHAAAV